MAFSYVASTSIGRVRLLISDRDEDTAVFSDEEIDAFLALEDNDIRLAAASALEAIAANETLVLKRITALDLTTDGPAVTKSLLEIAKRLRDTVAELPAFDIAEMVFDAHSERERLYKQALRGAI
jgi:hypothetical protein